MDDQGKYSRYALMKEMMETPCVIESFASGDTRHVRELIGETGRIFFTGEGSSRIFPAKNAISRAMRRGLPVRVATAGAREASEYHLDNYVVIGASNSGRTRELIALFDALRQAGHTGLFCLTANSNSRLESLCTRVFLLNCGKEEAVPATKSVVEQALFYEQLLADLEMASFSAALPSLAAAFRHTLAAPLHKEIIQEVAHAGTIYFAGRNDGVAEELALKASEIARKKSCYLEGTYLVHGVEEVMTRDDVIIMIKGFPAEAQKIRQVLVQGVGARVFAVDTRETIFPTIRVPDAGELSNYVCLAAGWNLLVEVGLLLGLDFDRPLRARKSGNAI